MRKAKSAPSTGDQPDQSAEVAVLRSERDQARAEAVALRDQLDAALRALDDHTCPA